MFFEPLAYLGMASGFVLTVIVIATFLYYVSEQLETHTVPAKRYITRYIYFVMAAHGLLWIGDRVPFKLTAWSLGVNYVYLVAMRSFPTVNFRSPTFVAACAGAVSSHFLWFWHFNDSDLPPHSIYDRVPTYTGETLPPFSEVASFFGLLIWTVPFLLFLGLSANDNVLPTANEHAASKHHRKGLARHTLERIWQWVTDTAEAFGYSIPGPKPALPL